MGKKYNLTVIISSRHDAESDEAQKLIQSIKDTCETRANVLFFANDGGLGLSALYHSCLEYTEIDTDIVVFCHDDITFLKPGWGEELLRLFKQNKEYGIIGVAGSDEFGDENSRGQAAWWRYTGSTYGQVLHRNRSEGKTWLTCFSPLLDHDLEEVCVIDGLFIAIDRTKIKKNFDSEIGPWNFYDIDFCLANYVSGVKIGVTTNIRIMHDSVGELKDNWYEQRQIVCDKYKEYLPIKINKKSKK